MARLPEALGPLIEEAIHGGFLWAADLRTAWTSRPFIAEGEALLLAWKGDQLAAMAVISAGPLAERDDTGRVRFVYVRSVLRRQGIADELVSRSIILAEERWPKLRLHTDNPAAARLDERHGFQAIDGAAGTTHVRSG